MTKFIQNLCKVLLSDQCKVQRVRVQSGEEEGHLPKKFRFVSELLELTDLGHISSALVVHIQALGLCSLNAFQPDVHVSGI